MSGTGGVLRGKIRPAGREQREGNNIRYGLLPCQNHQIARPSLPYDPRSPNTPQTPSTSLVATMPEKEMAQEPWPRISFHYHPPPCALPACALPVHGKLGALGGLGQLLVLLHVPVAGQSVTCRPWGQPQKLTSGWQSAPSQDSTGPPWAAGSWPAPWRCGSSRAAQPRHCCPACRPSC